MMVLVGFRCARAPSWGSRWEGSWGTIAGQLTEEGTSPGTSDFLGPILKILKHSPSRRPRESLENASATPSLKTSLISSHPVLGALGFWKSLIGTWKFRNTCSAVPLDMQTPLGMQFLHYPLPRYQTVRRGRNQKWGFRSNFKAWDNSHTGT